MQQEQREIIKGKTYFGLWFGKYFVINEDINEKSVLDNETVKNLIKSSVDHHADLEIRNVQFVVRPEVCYGYYKINSTLSVKFIYWGRAFKVMKLIRKNKKRFKKCYRAGKRKVVRIK